MRRTRCAVYALSAIAWITVSNLGAETTPEAQEVIKAVIEGHQKNCAELPAFRAELEWTISDPSVREEKTDTTTNSNIT